MSALGIVGLCAVVIVALFVPRLVGAILGGVVMGGGAWWWLFIPLCIFGALVDLWDSLFD